MNNDDQCLATDKGIQCTFDRTENSDYCLMHHHMLFPSIPDQTEVTVSGSFTFLLNGVHKEDKDGMLTVMAILRDNIKHLRFKISKTEFK